MFLSEMNSICENLWTKRMKMICSIIALLGFIENKEKKSNFISK